MEQMQSVLATEGEVAMFITERFHLLAEAARDGSEAPEMIRKSVAAGREGLVKERQQLIQQEVELYTIA